MHTSSTLRHDLFTVAVDDQPATIEDVFPGFHAQDRIGIVTSTPGGSMGASSLYMLALTRFYDLVRGHNIGNGPGQLRVYPDYFVFHLGRRHMGHFWMDLWPLSKEVVVEDDPEQILQAINDRGITRLIVEDIDLASATFLLESIGSAQLRIISALAYSPTGRVRDADVSISSYSQVEDYVLRSLDMTEFVSSDLKVNLKLARQPLLEAGRVRETFRRIEFDDALHKLTASNTSGADTRKHLAMLDRIGLEG